MDWHTQRPASRSKHRAHTNRTWESESPEIRNGEFKMAFFQVNVGQKLKWHRQATPASADVCCLKCLRRIVINQLHLVLPALLWCPLTHYHWCTATDKVHNTHTESNGETRKCCTYTHKHTYDDNKNNKMADTKGPGRGSLLFPVLVWWWLSLQSQNTSAVVWRGTGRFISVRTHRDAHTQTYLVR